MSKPFLREAVRSTRARAVPLHCARSVPEVVQAPLEHVVDHTPLSNRFEGIAHINNSGKPKVVSTDKHSSR